MDGKIRFHIDQFSIQGGNWQQRPLHLGLLDAPQKLRRARGDFYYLIEPLRHSQIATLCPELAMAMSDAYYQIAGSITRGLRAALIAANELLFDRNLRADGEHRALAGLCGVVLRDNEVYIGQLGPALVSWTHEGALQRFPADSIWLRSDNPGAFDLTREPPAGQRRESEPNLYHLTLSPGDALILSTTALARLTSEGDVLQAAALAGNGSTRSSLEALANGRDLSALVIECGSEGDLRAAPIQPAPQERAEPPAAEARPAARTWRLPGAQPITPAESAPQSTQITKPAEQPAATPPTRPAALPWRAPEPPITRPAQPEPEGVEEDEDAAEPERAQPEPRQPMVDFEELKRSLSQGVGNLRQGAEDVLLRVLPDRVPERPATASRADVAPINTVTGKALVLVALAIPLLVLFMVIMMRVQYTRTRQDQFSALQTTAQARLDSALAATDVVLTRQGLYEAMTVTDEGLAIDPNDETLNSIRRRIVFKLNEIDKVESFYHLWQLVELPEESASPTDSSRIVVQGVNIYVLNRGSDRVYKYLLNDVGDALQSVARDPALVQKGQTIDGVQLGDMVDIAWIEAGGDRTLSTFVTLERAGTLLSYDPQQGVDALPVANADTWLKPVAIGGYYGNLYVLDPLLDRILKYIPIDNAYTSPPGDYLNPNLAADLTGAVDMAVDGNMYVLFADGQIKKFYQGDQLSFTLAGLPSAMRSPTTIFVSGPKKPDGLGYVYVTDTGNSRILQFDKNGTYVRQFKAKQGESQLDKLRAVYVDEDNKRMYIVSGRTLWLADLPPMK